MVIAAMKLKDAYSLEGKLWLDLDSILKSRDIKKDKNKKQRHYFANKGPSEQGYGFSSGHVSMWELDHKESWDQKNWCF